MFFSWTIIIIVRTYVVSLALFTSFHCLIIVGWDEGVRYIVVIHILSMD